MSRMQVILATMSPIANYFTQVEEYESDSEESDGNDDSDEFILTKPVMTRSGRQVKAWAKFDV